MIHTQTSNSHTSRGFADLHHKQHTACKQCSQWDPGSWFCRTDLPLHHKNHRKAAKLHGAVCNSFSLTLKTSEKEAACTETCACPWDRAGTGVPLGQQPLHTEGRPPAGPVPGAGVCLSSISSQAEALMFCLTSSSS